MQTVCTRTFPSFLALFFFKLVYTAMKMLEITRIDVTYYVIKRFRFFMRSCLCSELLTCNITFA